MLRLYAKSNFLSGSSINYIIGRQNNSFQQVELLVIDGLSDTYQYNLLYIFFVIAFIKMGVILLVLMPMMLAHKYWKSVFLKYYCPCFPPLFCRRFHCSIKESGLCLTPSKEALDFL